MMDSKSAKQRIGPDRRPETPPRVIPGYPVPHWVPNNRKKAHPSAALETPRRPDPRQVTHQQSQVESADMDQQSLAHVGVPPDEDPTQPPGHELMRERSLHQLAPLPL